MRAPLMQHPLGADHEWLTTTVLITQTTWWEEGAADLRFLPVMTLPGTTNRFINNFASLPDAQGRYYYTSYPSLAYLAPYALFRMAGTPPSAVLLRWFNLLFAHLLGTILVYLLLMRLWPSSPVSARRLAALVAVAMYIWSPATLWYQSNVYMSDTFVQPLFVLGVYVAVRTWRAQRHQGWWLAAIGTTALLMTGSEWIGVFFTASLLLWAALRWRDRRGWAMAAASAAGSATAVVVTLWHYSLIAGLPALLAALSSKLASRSGLSGSSYASVSVMSSWLSIAGHYAGFWFAAIFAILGLAVWLWRVRGRVGAVPSVEKETIGLALLVSWTPVILHHVVFFDFTSVHSFSVLKTALPFAITVYLLVVGVLVASLAEPALRRRGAAVGVLVVGVFVVVAGGLQFFGQHRPEWSGPSQQQLKYESIGETMRASAPADQVVFVRTSGSSLAPMDIWYARRNLAVWKGPEAAAAVIARTGASGGVVFTLDSGGARVIATDRIGPSGETTGR